MSSISSIPSVAPVQAQRATAVDSDGDNDGSKAAAAATPVVVQPQVAKPTATMGNNVNTTA